jgi:hypothetical protein
MGALSIWHLSLVLFYAAIVVPCWRIVRRAGYSGAWSLFALVPGVNLVLLWVFAFIRWPAESAPARDR